MSRRNALPALYTLIAVALIVFTAWSLNHFRRYQPYASLFSQDEFAPRQFALQLTNVEMRGRSGGQPQWSVHADQIQLTPDQTSFVIESLKDGVLMRDAKPYLRFMADQAVYALGGPDQRASRVTVTGNIHIASVGPALPLAAPIAIATAQAIWNGYHSILNLPKQVFLTFSRTDSSPGIAIDSEGARWNAANHQLTCPDHVIANVDALGSYGAYKVESTGMVYDETGGQVVCQNPILVTVPALGTANCKPLLINTKQHTADFGQVHLVADAATVLAPMPTPAPPSPNVNSKPQTPASDDNTVHIDAPGGGHWDEQDRTLTIKGAVTFHQGDASMTTVGAIYDRKNDSAKALSPVTITDPETTVRGNVGTIDFKHHIATIGGSINIDVEPKPGKSSDDTSDTTEARQPSVLTCDAVDYDYRKKFAVTKGTVVIKQKHRTVTGDRGTYDTKNHLAKLSGNVVADSDDGKHMEADEATVSLKKGNEWIDVPRPKVIIFHLNDEDNPKS